MVKAEDCTIFINCSAREAIDTEWWLFIIIIIIN